MSWLHKLLGMVRAILRFVLGAPDGPPRLPRGPKFLRSLLRARESNFRFALLVGIPYLALLIWTHTQHELWRDEIHPWIIARQADGFWDLVMGDRRYDGHPPGWFWYLRPFTFFTRGPVGLHVATILLSFSSALLLLRYAPFARPIRLLLTFSFLLAFEYGVMCRNYSLGVLFTFLFCSLLGPLRSRPLLLALCLAGVALSSVYGAIVAACLLLVLLADSSRVGRDPGVASVLQLRSEKRAVWAAVLVLAAVGFSVWSSRPPDPNPYAPGVNLGALGLDGLRASLARLTWSTLPLRVFGDIGYWGNADAVWRQHPELFAAAGGILLSSMILVLSVYPIELLAFVVGGALIATVQIVVYPGAVRHWGHYLVLFLALCWTARLRHPRRWGFLMPALLLVIGLFQFEALVVAVREEGRRTFSAGGEAAAYIKRAGLSGTPVVGGPDWAMPAVMGHLDRNFVSCETAEVNQTLVFHARRRHCSAAMVLQTAIAEVQRTKAPVLLVTLSRVPGRPPAGMVKELLFDFQKPTATGEDFKVYFLAPSGTPLPKSGLESRKGRGRGRG